VTVLRDRIIELAYRPPSSIAFLETILS